MSWRTVLLRTRIEAVLTRGDPPRDPGDFKKSRRSGNIPVLLGSLLVSLIVGCNEGRVEQPAPKATAEQEKGQAGHETSEPHQLTVPPQALEGQTFQTAVVERRGFREAIQATANIKPNEYRLIHLSPRIEGRIIKVMAELGDRVKADQPLALLDSIELGRKKADYLQAKTNRDVDERNYLREEGLFKQRITSEKEYLDAKGKYEKSLAAYRATYEALRLIGLPDEQIKHISWSDKREPLSHFPLVSPQAGTVIERTITPGELITPKDKAFTIADLSTVWILLDIYEQHLGAVKVGSEVEITVDAYPKERFRGKIVYLSYLLNPDTRTVDARVEIANPDRRLRPGMFARAALILPSPQGDQQVLVVPQDAIQQVDEKSVAFVQERPGTYTVRPVLIGRRSGNDAEVLSGLTEGERTVTQGSFYLKSILLKERIAGG
ncbi:putative Secretion protein HlyD [Nitrospira moscoviensis]|uniref:Putative Secretion protein HlyD n=1 Tax=Nitrospira moscoviensis TaxID=42253 RepID=A0A0K2GEE3_NITMO|nr:putative Secretion protein HlyD [Nitrospira moscoviensis]